MGFGVAPREITQGNVQRIMYPHVPTAWVAYLAFGTVFIASVAYLWTRSAAADRLAQASAEEAPHGNPGDASYRDLLRTLKKDGTAR